MQDRAYTQSRLLQLYIDIQHTTNKPFSKTKQAVDDLLLLGYDSDEIKSLLTGGEDGKKL